MEYHERVDCRELSKLFGRVLIAKSPRTVIVIYARKAKGDGAIYIL